MRTTRLEEVTRVENWGEERGLLNVEKFTQDLIDTNAQTLKLMEEVGELAKAVADRD